jgi:hypothetical protein
MTMNDPIGHLLQAQERSRVQIHETAARDIVPIVVRAGRNAAQSIGGTGSYVIIDYDTTAYDPRGCVTTSPNWRFNAPVGGYYWVSAHARLAVSANWAQGKAADLRVYINGAAGPSLAYAANTGAGGSPLLSGAVLVHLDEDDYVEIKIAQGSGGNINIVGSTDTCWVSIARVS